MTEDAEETLQCARNDAEPQGCRPMQPLCPLILVMVPFGAGSAQAEPTQPLCPFSQHPLQLHL